MSKSLSSPNVLVGGLFVDSRLKHAGMTQVVK